MINLRRALLYISALVLGRLFWVGNHHSIQAAVNSGKEHVCALASCGPTYSSKSHHDETFNFLSQSHNTISARLSRREEETVPWPGSTFLVLSKDTSLAISLHPTTSDVVVTHISPHNAASARNARSHWQCVEQNGYFGFRNVHSDTYLGHDNGGRIRATAKSLEAWEMFTPRKHVGGGYLLLSPHWADRLHFVDVTEGTLRRTEGGGAVWEFRLV
jgi:hypothetical protein